MNATLGSSHSIGSHSGGINWTQQLLRDLGEESNMSSNSGGGSSSSSSSSGSSSGSSSSGTNWTQQLGEEANSTRSTEELLFSGKNESDKVWCSADVVSASRLLPAKRVREWCARASEAVDVGVDWNLLRGYKSHQRFWIESDCNDSNATCAAKWGLPRFLKKAGDCGSTCVTQGGAKSCLLRDVRLDFSKMHDTVLARAPSRRFPEGKSLTRTFDPGFVTTDCNATELAPLGPFATATSGVTGGCDLNVTTPTVVYSHDRQPNAAHVMTDWLNIQLTLKMHRDVLFKEGGKPSLLLIDALRPGGINEFDSWNELFAPYRHLFSEIYTGADLKGTVCFSKLVTPPTPRIDAIWDGKKTRFCSYVAPSTMLQRHLNVNQRALYPSSNKTMDVLLLVDGSKWLIQFVRSLAQQLRDEHVRVDYVDVTELSWADQIALYGRAKVVVGAHTSPQLALAQAGLRLGEERCCGVYEVFFDIAQFETEKVLGNMARSLGFHYEGKNSVKKTVAPKAVALGVLDLLNKTATRPSCLMPDEQGSHPGGSHGDSTPGYFFGAELVEERPVSDPPDLDLVFAAAAARQRAAESLAAASQLAAAGAAVRQPKPPSLATLPQPAPLSEMTSFRENAGSLSSAELQEKLEKHIHSQFISRMGEARSRRQASSNSTKKLSLSEHTAVWCEQMKIYANVTPGESWGSLARQRQKVWVAKKCDQLFT